MLKSGVMEDDTDYAVIGDYKKYPNEVGEIETALPEDVSGLVQDLLRKYKRKPPLDLYDVAEFHATFEKIHPFYDGNGRIGRLITLKQCLANDIVPFFINEEIKHFYYVGLKEWQTDNKKERHLDVCLTMQDDNVQVADENSHNIFYIQNIIKWLQEQKIDKDAMLSIEWKYLAILRSSEGFPPVYIWNELSSNPHFYIDVLRMMYGKDDNWKGTKEEKSIMKQQCFSLMFSWKQTPGVDFNGVFHADVLKQWMDVVIEQSEKYEIADIALSYFGKAAFYAPADEDGFFINKTVAK